MMERAKPRERDNEGKRGNSKVLRRREWGGM